MFRTLLPALALVVMLPCWHEARADDDKVMGSVHVPAGQTVEKATTVNGAVELGDHASVTRAATVNGHITLGQQATAGSVETVNGSARIGQGAHVLKGIELVNGGIDLDEGADVGGRITNVNGSIKLKAAHVGGGIVTTNGNIEIGADSHVEGGITVNHQDSGWFSWLGFGSDSSKSSDRPRIIIGPRAVVKGELRFLRDVSLYVSDTATIGTVDGATPVKFTGDHPPL
jgi:hypothetical protein